MLKNIPAVLQRPLARVGGLVFLLFILSAAAWGIRQTQIAPAQPIQFPHNLHISLGVQCLYCHPGALRGPSPGLPTQTKCWGCHQQLARFADPNAPWPAELQKLRAFVENNQPIQWVPVVQMPDFVQFTHRPHIAAGLNCETCHGEVSKMTVYENPQVMNMGWCLNCHRQRAKDNPELLARLTDCSTCHY